MWFDYASDPTNPHVSDFSGKARQSRFVYEYRQSVCLMEARKLQRPVGRRYATQTYLSNCLSLLSEWTLKAVWTSPASGEVQLGKSVNLRGGVKG